MVHDRTSVYDDPPDRNGAVVIEPGPLGSAARVAASDADVAVTKTMLSVKVANTQLLLLFLFDASKTNDPTFIAGGSKVKNVKRYMFFFKKKKIKHLRRHRHSLHTYIRWRRRRRCCA